MYNLQCIILTDDIREDDLNLYWSRGARETLSQAQDELDTLKTGTVVFAAVPVVVGCYDNP